MPSIKREKTQIKSHTHIKFSKVKQKHAHYGIFKTWNKQLYHLSTITPTMYISKKSLCPILHLVQNNEATRVEWLRVVMFIVWLFVYTQKSKTTKTT